MPQSLKCTFRIFQNLDKGRMWWHNILGDTNGSISHLLWLGTIAAGSLLLSANPVAIKRKNSDFILIVKRTLWRKSIDYSSQSIEADPSRVVKNNIFIVYVGYITRPSPIKLHISMHHMEKENLFKPQNLYLYEPTKICYWDCAAYIFSLETPTAG